MHGLGQTAQDWDRVLHELHLTEPVLCLELSAFCKDNTYQNLYEQVCAYSETYTDLHICGLSLGAVLALQYALEHEVGSLILIAPQYKMPKRLLQIQNIVFRFLPRHMFAQMGLTREQMIALTRSMVSIDWTAQLSKLRCPVYLLCGEKDIANRTAAKQMENWIPQAIFEEIRGAGHAVNLDAPKALAEQIQHFYETL